MSGMAAAAAPFWAEETLEAMMQHTNTASRPSELKITDLRVATVARAPMTCPVIRIDTNQGIYGLGEVRDGASKYYALLLKSRILGENPCDVDRIFRKTKQFGFHARQGGGVCAIEMALWDVAGKILGVPATTLLGGRFRDRVQVYDHAAPRNMLDPPQACPFQPRCRFEVEASRQEVPLLLEIEPGHKVACFNPVPADEWDRTRAAATA